MCLFIVSYLFTIYCFIYLSRGATAQCAKGHDERCTKHMNNNSKRSNININSNNTTTTNNNNKINNHVDHNKLINNIHD